MTCVSKAAAAAAPTALSASPPTAAGSYGMGQGMVEVCLDTGADIQQGARTSSTAGRSTKPPMAAAAAWMISITCGEDRGGTVGDMPRPGTAAHCRRTCVSFFTSK